MAHGSDAAVHDWMARLSHDPQSSGGHGAPRCGVVVCGLGTHIISPRCCSHFLQPWRSRSAWRAPTLAAPLRADRGCGAALPLLAYGYVVFARSTRRLAMACARRILDGGCPASRHRRGLPAVPGRFAPNVVMRAARVYVYPLLVIGCRRSQSVRCARRMPATMDPVALLAGAALQLVHAFNYGVTRPASYSCRPSRSRCRSARSRLWWPPRAEPRSRWGRSRPSPWWADFRGARWRSSVARCSAVSDGT